jgi:hypothetical protein
VNEAADKKGKEGEKYNTCILQIKSKTMKIILLEPNSLSVYNSTGSTPKITKAQPAAHSSRYYR